MQDIITEIGNYAQNHFLNARHSHDWDHTIRVHNLCMKIGEAENADMPTLSIAAYLHDIGRSAQDLSQGKICHARQGAEMAKDILSKYDLMGRYGNIIHCIRTHRFRNEDKPETLEARILFDADKLDAIGAIGIARTFAYGGAKNSPIHLPDQPPVQHDTFEHYKAARSSSINHFHEKLLLLKDRINTPTAHHIAQQRHDFMLSYLDQFHAEWEGYMTINA